MDFFVYCIRLMHDRLGLRFAGLVTSLI